MTKEQARVFVKAEKNKMTPAQIHENSRQIIDRLISQDFFYSADTVLTYVSYNQEVRSEEHTSELQSQSTISYAVFCLKK